MELNGTLQVILECFAAICGMGIIAFLVFGWLKGMYWETQLKNKRRYKY
jgi:hypothetical protein